MLATHYSVGRTIQPSFLVSLKGFLPVVRKCNLKRAKICTLAEDIINHVNHEYNWIESQMSYINLKNAQNWQEVGEITCNILSCLHR